MFKSSKIISLSEAEAKVKGWLDKENILGHGGYATVYKITELHPVKMVLKLFSSKNLNWRESLDKELRTLQNHKHKLIVQCFGYVTKSGEGSEKIGIIMEMAERQSLKEVIFNPIYQYSIYTVICWMEQLFSALEYLEKIGQLHRDIKPDKQLFAQFIYDNGSGLFFGLDELKTVFRDKGSLEEVETLSCPKSIRDLVLSCCHFDPNQRPTASEVTRTSSEIRKEFEEKNIQYGGFWPLNDELAVDVFRPRGFNGKNDLVAVEKIQARDDRNDSIENPALSPKQQQVSKRSKHLQKIKKLLEPSGQKLEYKPRNLNLMQASMQHSQPKLEVIFDFSFVGLYTKEIAIFEFSEKNRYRDLFERLTGQDLAYSIGGKKPIRANTYLQPHVEVKTLAKFFGLIHDWKRFNLFPDYRERIKRVASKLEKLKKTCKRVKFWVFKTKDSEEWLKLGEIFQKGKTHYVKKDFSETKDDGEINLEKSHVEEISIELIIEKANELWKKVKEPLYRSHTIVSEVGGQDLKSKGYIYELTHAPEFKCECTEVKCPLIRAACTFIAPRCELEIFYPHCSHGQSGIYSYLFYDFSHLVYLFTKLEDFMDLCETVAHIYYLKKQVFTQYPCYFQFLSLKSEKEKKNVLVLDLSPLLNGNEDEIVKLQCLDPEAMKLLNLKVSRSTIELNPKHLNLYTFDLRKYDYKELMRQSLMKFSRNYRSRQEICPFFKSLGISSDEIDESLDIVSRVCLAIFEFQFPDPMMEFSNVKIWLKRKLEKTLFSELLQARFQRQGAEVVIDENGFFEKLADVSLDFGDIMPLVAGLPAAIGEILKLVTKESIDPSIDQEIVRFFSEFWNPQGYRMKSVPTERDAWFSIKAIKLCVAYLQFNFYAAETFHVHIWEQKASLLKSLEEIWFSESCEEVEISRETLENEWILVEPISKINCNYFLKSDFSQIAELIGEKKNSTKTLKKWSAKRMHYLFMIKSLEDWLAKRENLEEIHKGFFLRSDQGQDLPNKGYIFELSFSPKTYSIAFETLNGGRCTDESLSEEYTKLHRDFSYLLFLLSFSIFSSSYFSLIKAIEHLVFLKKSLESRECPTYFLFGMLRKTKGERVFVLDFLDYSQVFNESNGDPTKTIKLPCMDEKLDFFEKEIRIGDLDLPNLEEPLELKDFLSEKMLQNLLANFSAAYIQYDDVCNFLAQLKVKRNNLKEALEMTQKVCLDVFHDEKLCDLAINRCEIGILEDNSSEFQKILITKLMESIEEKVLH